MPSPAEVMELERSKKQGVNIALTLQVEELLKSNSPVYEKLSKVDKFVESLITSVKSLPEVSIGEDYRVRFPELRFEQLSKYPLVCRPPTICTKVGSYFSRTLVKPACNIDVLVTIPSSCFQAKDYNNYRYLDKRNAYTGYLKESLLSLNKPEWTVSITCMHSESTRPIVSVHYVGSAWTVNLIPCASADLFDHLKLVDGSCCVRRPDQPESPTPVHNQAILQDLHMHKVLGISMFKNGREAVQLMRIWLSQRGLLSEIGLSGYHASMFILHAATVASIPADASALQQLKICLVNLSRCNWEGSSLMFGTLETIAAPQYGSAGLYISSYNALHRVPALAMTEVSREAAAAVTVLNAENSNDLYTSLFARKHSSAIWWDFQVKLAGNDLITAVQVVKRALGDRLTRLSVRLNGQVTLVGELNSFSNSAIEKGPAADSSAAEEFRDFWKSKAEVRRFKDGSILECVAWSNGANVAQQILSFVATEHLPGASASVCPLGATLAVTTADRELWAALDDLKAKITASGASVKNVHAVAPQFSYTEVGSAEWLDVLVEVEQIPQGNWPEKDALAVWYAKVSVLITLLKSLRAEKCNVEIAAEDNARDPWLDVVVAGHSFRVRAYHDREISRSISAVIGLDQPRPVISDISKLRSFYYAPRLRQQIHALTLKFPGFGGAVKAVKAWADNRLCSIESEEFIEMSVATIFLSRPLPPNSPHVAFLCWLEWMSKWVWAEEPLLVTFDADGLFNRAALLRQFSACAGKNRPLPFWMSCDLDPHAILSTVPSEVTMKRLQEAAKLAILSAASEEWSLIENGTDNFSFYDIIVTLNEKADLEIILETLRASKSIEGLVESIGGSTRHRLLGLRLRHSAFTAQKTKALMSSVPQTIIEHGDGELAIAPDLPWLLASIGALLKGWMVDMKMSRRSMPCACIAF